MIDKEHQYILDRFGRLLVTHSRDVAIKMVEKILDGKMKSATRSQISASLSNLTQEQRQAIHDLSVLTFNETIGCFFEILERYPEFKLIYKGNDECVNLLNISDGLFGELFDEDGWIDRYSQFKELTLY